MLVLDEQLLGRNLFHLPGQTHPYGEVRVMVYTERECQDSYLICVARRQMCPERFCASLEIGRRNWITIIERG